MVMMLGVRPGGVIVTIPRGRSIAPVPWLRFQRQHWTTGWPNPYESGPPEAPFHELTKTSLLALCSQVPRT